MEIFKAKIQENVFLKALDGALSGWLVGGFWKESKMLRLDFGDSSVHRHIYLHQVM